jgi:predicted AlkP superfamily phosphohydrolase/phosphomutase
MPLTRLLVLGIDGANPRLLEAGIADGTLPHLAALAAQGTSGPTRGVQGFFIGSTWPSLCTGLTPARHGIHYTAQLRPGSYAFRNVIEEPPTSHDPFWTWSSRAGQRVAVLDVPLSRPDPSLNGVQLVEWGGHDAVFGFRASSTRHERDILARFGPHPLGPSCDADQRNAQEYADFIGTLVRGVHVRSQLTRHLLRQGGWDLFMQVFTETHCAGHQCWHLHDAAHPAHDPAYASTYGDPLRRVYAAVDEAIGEVIADAGDASVLVIAPHGMAHWFGAQFLLHEILDRLGVSQPAPPRSDIAPSAAQRVWRSLPLAARRPLEPLRRRVEARAQSALPRLHADPSRSSCFVVPNGFPVGAIRLNLRGREPQGVLARADADVFCADLERALLDIIDERTDGPAITRVVRTAALYEGESLHDLPDLLVEWSDDVATGSTRVGGGAAAHVRLRSPRIGTIEGSNDYGRTGEHRPDGLFIAAGRGIRRARHHGAAIVDFAPTIARMLGVVAPQTDGVIVSGLDRKIPLA